MSSVFSQILDFKSVLSFNSASFSFGLIQDPVGVQLGSNLGPVGVQLGFSWGSRRVPIVVQLGQVVVQLGSNWGPVGVQLGYSWGPMSQVRV